MDILHSILILNEIYFSDLHKWSFKYKLYRYFDENYISLNNTLFIQPILFIPGSQGWYQNVQSIGTVVYISLNLIIYIQIEAFQNETDDHFYDIYTTDLGQELTAFSGLRLEKQGKYVCDLVINLLEIHREAKSVLILAHSMGGVVARVAAIQKYCVYLY